MQSKTKVPWAMKRTQSVKCGWLVSPVLRACEEGRPWDFLCTQALHQPSFFLVWLPMSDMPRPPLSLFSYPSADQQNILPFSSPTKSLVWFLDMARAVTAGLVLLGFPVKAKLTSSSLHRAIFFSHLWPLGLGG